MNKVFDLILDQNKIFVNEIFYYHLREICIQENFKINISIQFEGNYTNIRNEVLWKNIKINK